MSPSNTSLARKGPTIRSFATAKIGSNTDLAALLLEQGVALSRTNAAAGTPAVNLEYKESVASGRCFGLLLNLLPVPALRPLPAAHHAAGAGFEFAGDELRQEPARLFTGSKVTVTFA